MTTWACTLPNYDLISPNKLMRMKWFMQSKQKEHAMQMIALFGRPLPRFDEPVAMVIIRRYGKRQRALDTDNMYGGCKLLIDAMKAPKGRSKRGLSILMDDDPRSLDLWVSQCRNTDDSCDVSIYACRSSESIDIPDDVAMILQQSPKSRTAR